MKVFIYSRILMRIFKFNYDFFVFSLRPQHFFNFYLSFMKLTLWKNNNYMLNYFNLYLIDMIIFNDLNEAMCFQQYSHKSVIGPFLGQSVLGCLIKTCLSIENTFQVIKSFPGTITVRFSLYFWYWENILESMTDFCSVHCINLWV